MSQPLLQLRLLGDLALRRGGAAPLALPASRRTRALLGYLVATAAPQSRAALCDLLWDGPDDPRASLRWSLTKLRPLVDDAVTRRLVADREHVAFEAQGCDIDTVRVQALLAGGLASTPLAALEEAAGLLRGEFLDGLDLPACYRFHHWCMAERERHGRCRRDVLQALVDRLAHEPERALPHGRAMVAADPLAEPAHAVLVRLLDAAGHYAEAERHYGWARELLRREVALAPGGALDDAIHAARRARRHLAVEVHAPAQAVATPAAPATPDAPDAPVLLGRDAECAAIASALRGEQPARLLLFTGEPGIGKTRLLDHFAQGAAAAGRRLIRGRCFEAERVRPYGLWLDALRGVSTQGIDAPTLAQAAPLLAGRVPDVGHGGNRERLFDAAAALVGGWAAQQKVALVFDDLQWIDEASAALLHFLVRALGDDGSVALFAGAARAGEVDDNPWAKGLLQSLRREGALRRLALAPLGEADAHVLLGDAIDARDALRQTGGNPLYLVELASAARRGVDATGRTVDGLIDERLGALDDASRDTLAWAAAMGSDLRPELLAAAAGWPVAELLMRLERFERHGLMTAAGPGHVDFAHDLVRQAVYRAISQPRRRVIHRQIARALAAAAVDDPRLHGEIVRHAALTGDMLGAARACLAAGEHCLRVFANVQAADVAERGLAHVGELEPGAVRIELEIGLLRLRVAAAAQPGGRQLPALAERIERAIDAAEALGLHAPAAAGWEILAYWQQRASDSERTRDATLAAERMTRRADTTTHCLQLANSGRCLLDIEADAPRGRALLAEAAALAAQLGLKVMEIDWGQGLIARADGDLDAACQALGRAVGQAQHAANHWREFECRVWLATVEFERGRDAAVLAQVDEIVAAARRMGESGAPFVQALGALARWRHGHADAEAALLTQLTALRELDDKAHLAYALNEAAALALAAGRRDEARAWAGDALAAARAVRRPTEVAVALARLACSAAEPHAARTWLAQAHGLESSGRASARAAGALDLAARAVPTLTPTPAP